VADGVREVRQSTGLNGAGTFLDTLPQLAKSGAEIAEVTARPAFSNVLHSGLLDRLGDPRTLQLLETLFDKLDTAVFLLEAVDGFLKRSDEIAESASSMVGDLRQSTLDLGEAQKIAQRTPKILEALGQLTESRALERVPDLVNATMVLAESGMLDPKLVRILGDVGHRLAGAYSDAASILVRRGGASGCSRRWASPKCNGRWACWWRSRAGSAAIYTERLCTSCRSRKAW
jgi:hypothetical protein